MASIFKRGGRKNRDGDYQISYFDENGRRKTVSAKCADKEVAKAIGAKVEAEVAKRRSGLVTASDEAFISHNRRPIAEHIRAYLDHCEHVGQDAVHRKNKTTQLAKMIEGTGAAVLSDLTRERVQAHLANLLKASRCKDGAAKVGLSHRTHNQHRATILSFAEWCVDVGRMQRHGLSGVPSLNEAKDRRRVRRAATDEELALLFAVPEAVANGRAIYYLLASLSGIRVKAARAATWGDVDFTGNTIRVAAKNAKGKGCDWHINLHPQLSEALAKARPANASPADKLFPLIPTIRTFHRDCERAGVARFDQEGRQLDRHALRTTMGTRLARAGVTPQLAMKLLGHTDVRVTMKHYTDLRLSDTGRALDLVPSIECAQQNRQQAPDALRLSASASVPSEPCQHESPSSTATTCHEAQVGYTASLVALSRDESQHEQAMSYSIVSADEIRAVGAVGYRPSILSTDIINNLRMDAQGHAAESTAVSAALRSFPELAALIMRWPSLPAVARQRILSLAVEARMLPSPSTSTINPDATQGTL